MNKKTIGNIRGYFKVLIFMLIVGIPFYLYGHRDGMVANCKGMGGVLLSNKTCMDETAYLQMVEDFQERNTVKPINPDLEGFDFDE